MRTVRRITGRVVATLLVLAIVTLLWLGIVLLWASAMSQATPPYAQISVGEVGS